MEPAQPCSLAFDLGEDLVASFTRLLNKLGGFKPHLKENEPILIAISLPFPDPTPCTTSIAILSLVLQELKSMHSPKLQVVAATDWDFDTEKTAQILGIGDIIRDAGAELVYLDSNPDAMLSGSDASAHLPSLIMNAPNFIAIPAVRFDPVLGFWGASTLNSSFLPLLRKSAHGNAEQCERDADVLQESWIDAMLAAFNAKPPNLTIIDGHHLLVGQGPHLATGATRTNGKFLLAGKNAYALDLVLANLLGFDVKAVPLLTRAMQKQYLNESDIRQETLAAIKQSSPEGMQMQLATCDFARGLSPRISVQTGKTCIHCKRHLRWLVDCLSELCPKDLNYLQELNIIAGINPPVPPSAQNLCIFGNCACTSTKGADFRTIKQMKLSKKGVEKAVVKRNKSILEVPGCPPLPLEALQQFMKKFSKANMPITSFWLDAWKTARSKPKLKILKGASK